MFCNLSMIEQKRSFVNICKKYFCCSYIDNLYKICKIILYKFFNNIKIKSCSYLFLKFDGGIYFEKKQLNIVNV